VAVDISAIKKQRFVVASLEALSLPGELRRPVNENVDRRGRWLALRGVDAGRRAIKRSGERHFGAAGSCL